MSYAQCIDDISNNSKVLTRTAIQYYSQIQPVYFSCRLPTSFNLSMLVQNLLYQIKKTASSNQPDKPVLI